MKNYIDILGTSFRNMSTDNARKYIKEAMDLGNRIKIFTPNPYILLQATKDKALSAALRSAELLLPDGIGIIIASKILRTPLTERITGIDTAKFILSEAEKSGLRVFLLGAAPNVAELAAKKLREEFNSLNICGTHHGYFKKAGKENDKVTELIRKSSPHILFVCFGSPDQEKWICDNEDSLPSVKLFAGLGGSLDVWSGRIKRAPPFVQKSGFEWLWRAIREPKRLKYLLQLPVFIKKTFKQKALLREKSGGG